MTAGPRAWSIVVPAILSLLASSCATIDSSTRIETTPEPSTRTERVVPDSSRYRLTHSLNGTTLAVAVERTATCERAETPMLRRTQRTENTVRDDRPLILDFVIAALGLGVGPYSYVRAEALAAKPDSDGTTHTPQEYRVGGAILTGAGVLGAVALVVELVRATDTSEDLGVVPGEPQLTQWSCDQPLGPDVAVQLKFPSGTSLAGQVASDGVARLPLLRLTSDDLAHITEGATFEVAGQTAPLSFRPEAQRALGIALERDPQSRLATEKSAGARCGDLLQQALAPQARSAQALAALEAARTFCQITPAMRQNLGATEVAVTEAVNRLREAARRKAVEALKRNDPRAALEQVAAEPEIAASLRGDEAMMTLLRDSFAGPFQQAALGGNNEALLDRLCSTRALLQRLLGAQWDADVRAYRHELAASKASYAPRAIQVLDFAFCR